MYVDKPISYFQPVVCRGSKSFEKHDTERGSGRWRHWERPTLFFIFPDLGVEVAGADSAVPLWVAAGMTSPGGTIEVFGAKTRHTRWAPRHLGTTPNRSRMEKRRWGRWQASGLERGAPVWLARPSIRVGGRPRLSRRWGLASTFPRTGPPPCGLFIYLFSSSPRLASKVALVERSAAQAVPARPRLPLPPFPEEKVDPAGHVGPGGRAHKSSHDEETAAAMERCALRQPIQSK